MSRCDFWWQHSTSWLWLCYNCASASSLKAEQQCSTSIVWMSERKLFLLNRLYEIGLGLTLDGLPLANCLQHLKSCLLIKREPDSYEAKSRAVYCLQVWWGLRAGGAVWHSWGPIFNRVPACHWSLVFPLNGDVEKQWHVGKASETSPILAHLNQYSFGTSPPK